MGKITALVHWCTCRQIQMAAQIDETVNYGSVKIHSALKYVACDAEYPQTSQLREM